MRKRDGARNTTAFDFLQPSFVHVVLREDHDLLPSVRQQKEKDIGTDLVHAADGGSSARRPGTARLYGSDDFAVRADCCETGVFPRSQGNLLTREILPILPRHPLAAHPSLNHPLNACIRQPPVPRTWSNSCVPCPDTGFIVSIRKRGPSPGRLWFVLRMIRSTEVPARHRRSSAHPWSHTVSA